MQIRTRNILTPLFAATVLAASGCASHSDLDKVRAEAREAQRAADHCSASARQAKTTADEANERAIRNEEMVNRCFKHSMHK